MLQGHTLTASPTSLAEALKNKYRKEQYVPTLLSDKPQPIAAINLTIVENVEEMKSETGLSFFENIHNVKDHIDTETIFEPLPFDKIAPKRLLILGRPGIGKTTMSQYFAYRWATDSKETKLTSHQPSTLWHHQFDYVFWIPLRKLKIRTKDDVPHLAKVIYEECCQAVDAGIVMAPAQRKITENDLIDKIQTVLEKNERCLMLLDGYDEVANLIAGEETRHPFIKKILQDALKCQYVIVTSRPYQIYQLKQFTDKAFDRTLENRGFTNEQIRDYVERYFSLDSTKSGQLLDFLKNNGRIWGTAHIPINLSLICWVWQKKTQQNEALDAQMTMTSLYREITRYDLAPIL